MEGSQRIHAYPTTNYPLHRVKGIESGYCLFITKLGPSINGLVSDGNTKLSCRGFILALFQSTTANKIDFEHAQDYKRLLSVCELEILRVTVKIIEVFSSFYVDF